MIYSLTATLTPGAILVAGKDGRIHRARIIKRSFKPNQITGFGTMRKYLYLTHRDGKTVRQIYLGKLA
ncbi:hypothetical protein LCGC14_2363230 [marine sediment metagenome]|uniref:Uncharacterized protein n=1 Tax=marine sediment metagenome TaxID=412755 RepID=A0A0F9C5V0_9ZZZZ